MAQSEIKRTRNRNYVFTDFELLNWEGIYETNKRIIRYIGLGREVCPKTGTPHLQGFIQLHVAKELTFVKKLTQSDSLHLERMIGTVKQNMTYCSKGGEFTEYGTPTQQGARTDILDVFHAIRSGEDLFTISSDNPELFCKYRNGINQYKEMHNDKSAPKWRMVEVIFITGPTNTGKTRRAMEEATFQINGYELEWWNGYDSDDVICIDEYNNDIPITKLLKYLDGYKLRLPIKGGFTFAKWHKVYITSNLRLEELHTQAKPEHIKALRRRITKVIDLWPIGEEEEVIFNIQKNNFLE